MGSLYFPPVHGFKTLTFVEVYTSHLSKVRYCQTLGLVLRLRVDFVLPLSQEQQQEEQEQEEPLTKIYQKGVY